MTDKNNKRTRGDSKIQHNVPIRTVGIETQRERTNYSDLPPQNYVHVWWARRPTPVTRLALLGSILPEDVDDDQLLQWMGITPNNVIGDSSIPEHVRQKKRTEDERDGLLYEHYGYRKSYKNLPKGEELEGLHSKAKESWGDELPTVLDATAGGGSIPFESIRYEFPTVANELNPVASVILKAVLQHPRANGDLSNDIETWGKKIGSQVRKNLREFFPKMDGSIPLEYLWAHTITCPDCSLTIPLAPNWWLDKSSSNEGVAAKPSIVESEDSIEFEIVTLPDDVTKSEYNPNDGTISYAKATCPRCNVTIDTDEIRSQAQGGDLDSQLYAIHIEHTSKSKNGERSFRAPKKEDLTAISKARQKVQNDVELSTLLDVEVPSGFNTDQARRYGFEKWRDMYTPRQLLTHHEYLQQFRELKPEIEEEHEEDSDIILTFLAFAADKGLNYNSRFSSWIPSRTSIRSVFERQDFAFQWSFTESNLTAEELGYRWTLDSMIEVYEELRELSGHSNAPTTIYQGDASNLVIDDREIDVVVLDPPYYDNVMYSEISDYFYVWMKEYLYDVYPRFFGQELTEKNDEAVANPSRFEGIAGDGQSKNELAKEHYDDKMSNIFSEIHRVLDDSGIFTMMFTHKKTEAWDTLTSALIEAGFVITSSHPVSTERSADLSIAGKNSAQSTILLTSEKRTQNKDEVTLWSDIKKETQVVARERAEELDRNKVDFAKVDIILASFGPALEVFTSQYPVVDDEGKNVSPQAALNEARAAVRDYFVDKYLNEGIREVDPKTEWYILAWLVFEAKRFPYDEAHRLAIGVGEDLDTLKKSNRMWRKKSGDVLLRPHQDRVQDINKDPDSRSGRKPVDPDALSFATALDKVHAAMHIYETKGATEAWNWMNDRNCGSDPAFKSTLEGLLRVLPHDHHDWELARDITAGETGDLLNLDLDANIFQDDDDDDEDVQGSLNDF